LGLRFTILTSELPGKYIASNLFRWDDNKFEDEYLKKLKKNWIKWNGKEIEEEEASFSKDGTLREEYCYSVLGH